MRWTVHVLNAGVEAEIEALPADMQARYLRLADLIEAHGLDRIGAPHVKHLEGKLWGTAHYWPGRHRPCDLRHSYRPPGGGPACLREEDPKDPAA